MNEDNQPKQDIKSCERVSKIEIFIGTVVWIAIALIIAFYLGVSFGEKNSEHDIALDAEAVAVEPEEIEAAIEETTVDIPAETEKKDYTVGVVALPEPSDGSVSVERPEPIIDQHELELLALVIYQEVGGHRHCDDCRRRVADVVLNRVADPGYPDTIEGVLTQKAQYGTLYYTGIKWPSRYSREGEKANVEKAYQIAREVLLGNHSEIYGKGYVYQAEFKQGDEGFWCCGHYFARDN